MQDVRKNYPSIGASPEEIIDLIVRRRWVAQDSFYRPFLRTVEDSLRMIAGRHWDVWIDVENRFVDVSRWMNEEERKWRQRPVFNWSGYWFMITHAKLTENPPIVSFLPATSDRMDSILADIMDPIWDYQWDVLRMDDKVDMLARWVVGAGSGTIKSFWDADAGELEEAVGPARVPLLDDRGMPILNEVGEPESLTIPEVPWNFDPETEEPIPMVEPLPGGVHRIVGDAARLPKGEIGVRVINSLNVRTSRHPVPFYEKPWWVERTVMHVDEIYDRYGVQVEPERGVGEDNGLDELLFGLGDPGSSAQGPPTSRGSGDMERDGFAVVWELTEMPNDDIPDGRHTVVTRTELLDDDVNLYAPDYRPYEQVDFVGLPHRPIGKTPMEDIAPINRTYNRGWGQILEHRNLMTNPKWIVDSLAQIKKVTNQPGEVLRALRRPGVPAIEGVQPPQLPDVVYEIQSMLKAEMQDIGSLRSGSEGRSPNAEASGELVKELRFNDDRFIGPAGGRFVRGIARMGQEWMKLLEFGWDDERMIRVSGTDNTARFLTVRPQMFEGRVNVKAVTESMLPEGRGERQKRLDFWLEAGLISPKKYFEMYNHPHLGELARPGGVDARMAEREHAAMLRGTQVLPIEPHDDIVHMEMHREFMAAPEFVELPPEIQQLFFVHNQAHEIQMFNKAIKQASQAAVAAELQPEPQMEGGQTAGNAPTG